MSKLTKDKYVESLAAKIEETDQDIDYLESRLNTVSQGEQDNLGMLLSQLTKERDQLRLRFLDLKESSDDVWELVGEELEALWLALNESLRSTKSRFV